MIASAPSRDVLAPTGGLRALARRVHAAGTRDVSGASAAFFRIAFGVGMIVNCALYLPVLVHEYYVAPELNFPYAPLTFVQPVPGFGMHLVYVAMMAAGALIALGLFYRWAITGFFVLHTYVFLVDSTYFQNHEYLIVLLAFLLILLPVDRMWSLDARRRPEHASATVPAWVVWLLRFQIAIPYVYGGIAKMNSDWLAGEPLRTWLAARTDVPVIGRWFTAEPVVLFMNHGSMIFDLVVVPLLLWRRTRIPAFVVAVCFHLLNVRLFGLFIFPWLMIAATTIFFPPDWPLRLRARFASGADTRSCPPVTARHQRAADPRPLGVRGGLALGAAIVWVAVQVLVPLRHLAIPGSPSWTEEGHRFAWHMMLRHKQGTATFLVDDGERVVRVDPRDLLSPKQAARLPTHPDRIVQFAHHLSELHGGAEVRAETAVSLNGRPHRPIVDPTVDLASVPTFWIGHAEWILLSDEPLP